MGMQEELQKLQSEVLRELQGIKDKSKLEDVRLRTLGKKGSLTMMLRAMGKLPPEERPQMGQMINSVRERITAQLEEAEKEFRRIEQKHRLEKETIDITEPTRRLEAGGAHPLTLVQDRLIEIFTGMGFDVAAGPEVEEDLFNFELLNIPRNHPARDAQATFYINNNVVLRTHTSPVQAHTMLQQKPPIRMICPGRVYRADEVDATHSPVFHQMEGLVIDKGVTMSDLKGTLQVFVSKLYGEGMQIRFRPSFFPFTEPSAEVDMTCVACHGKGCRVCKGTGWIEVLGAGMVNPRVLEMCGIDPAVYSGFAFGIGIERITMLHYGITDMRLLYEGDVRFLSQFHAE